MAFNWQQKGWPNATVNRAALKDELDAFGAAFSRVKAALRKPQNPVALMSALVDEAVKTSAIEGVGVDESVVVSSICKALGLGDVPVGFTKDARAEGVAQMVLAVRRDWKKPLSAQLIKAWHGALLANDPRGVTVGDFRSHAEPMRVIRRAFRREVDADDQGVEADGHARPCGTREDWCDPCRGEWRPDPVPACVRP